MMSFANSHRTTLGYIAWVSLFTIDHVDGAGDGCYAPVKGATPNFKIPPTEAL